MAAPVSSEGLRLDLLTAHITTKRGPRAEFPSDLSGGMNRGKITSSQLNLTDILTNEKTLAEETTD